MTDGQKPRLPGHAKRGAAAIASVQRVMKNHLYSYNAAQKFGQRGLSEKTIRALVDCAIDAPERLLFMTEEQLITVPGIGKVGMSEIRAYRALFLEGK